MWGWRVWEAGEVWRISMARIMTASGFLEGFARWQTPLRCSTTAQEPLFRQHKRSRPPTLALINGISLQSPPVVRTMFSIKKCRGGKAMKSSPQATRLNSEITNLKCSILARTARAQPTHKPELQFRFIKQYPRRAHPRPHRRSTPPSPGNRQSAIILPPLPPPPVFTVNLRAFAPRDNMNANKHLFMTSLYAPKLVCFHVPRLTRGSVARYRWVTRRWSRRDSARLLSQKGNTRLQTPGGLADAVFALQQGRRSGNLF